MVLKIMDGWFVIHLLGGFLVGGFIKERFPAYFAFCVAEAVENTAILEKGIWGEGIADTFYDIAQDIAGYELGRKYGNKKI